MLLQKVYRRSNRPEPWQFIVLNLYLKAGFQVKKETSHIQLIHKQIFG
jgi:hypothetical protein